MSCDALLDWTFSPSQVVTGVKVRPLEVQEINVADDIDACAQGFTA
jgi:hypothetical protein